MIIMIYVVNNQLSRNNKDINKDNNNKDIIFVRY